ATTGSEDREDRPRSHADTACELKELPCFHRSQTLRRSCSDMPGRPILAMCDSCLSRCCTDGLSLGRLFQELPICAARHSLCASAPTRPARRYRPAPGGSSIRARSLAAHRPSNCSSTPISRATSAIIRPVSITRKSTKQGQAERCDLHLREWSPSPSARETSGEDDAEEREDQSQERPTRLREPEDQETTRPEPEPEPAQPANASADAAGNAGAPADRGRPCGEVRGGRRSEARDAGGCRVGAGASRGGTDVPVGFCQRHATLVQGLENLRPPIGH